MSESLEFAVLTKTARASTAAHLTITGAAIPLAIHKPGRFIEPNYEWWLVLFPS